MKRLLCVLGWLLMATMLLCQCSESDNDNPIGPEICPSDPAKGLYVVNAGNFNAGNATLSFYEPNTRSAFNEIFVKANDYKLGDTAQSITCRNNIGWVVVNNSHIIYAIDLATNKEKGRLTGITSPRYICFQSDEKAYVSSMYSDQLTIINPKTYSVIGSITVPKNSEVAGATGSTEEMVLIGNYLYVTCWSYEKTLLKIDTTTDKVVGKVAVGIQPSSLVADRNGKLWTICDGGYEGSPVGYEAPTLCRIDPEKMAVEETLTFTKGDYISKLRINGSGDKLYWLNGGALYSMAIDGGALPSAKAIEADGYLYALTIDPTRNEIYVADAIDYQQPGIIYRYTATGELMDSFYVGVIPTEFGWNL